MSVLIETSLGDIVIDLYTEETPLTSKSFLKLCKIKYYNFTLFHRVERGFIAQGGDPTGSGQGGQSIYGELGGTSYIPAEIRPQLKHRKAGTVSMAGGGLEGGSGSQFFITLADNLEYLDGKHTVFGSVTEGMDIVEQLGQSITDQEFRPLRDILIRHTIILNDPFEDPAGLPCPNSPILPTNQQQSLMRIEAGVELPSTNNESDRLGDTRAQALTLEMIGDLPFADIKPPENILFVCKLNPITGDDDLKTIFARFGHIDSCQVIRDRETGDSLGYAFIEFKDKEACEEAYFKMDNVLVDDRRIHVDFSQSVSRINGKWVRLNDNSSKKGLKIKSRYRDDSRESDRKDSYQMVFDMSRNRDNLSRENDRGGKSSRRTTSRWDRRTRSRSPTDHHAR
ncbi:cyclophilin-like protein [Coemansia reversa NRRL 1564]|uniref:Peptidyl-prolyl cis-trans isomerase n=1 Tax=Coemansia reversa (strain ATCC 12441 / NRRL 1564) TaxID=763665 RepID=A0A2G5B688_COERN|nr:cyclophilin-like protein [Coemansia reversa NRRL 1564]|eukprot:PIA14519.1 cyclophilin-like protein [Coemansia reversa NRRL 1564]